jgi:mono/diheme cytochrome c family protein
MAMTMKNHWTAPDEALKKVNPVARDSVSVAQGKKLYFNFCAGCHGDKAQGNGPYAASLSTKPSDLKAMSGGHEDGDFAWKITNGRGDMPSWKDDLKTEEIWSLVNYIQSLSKKNEHHK